MSADRYQFAAADFLAGEGEALVLCSGQLYRLSALAALIVYACRQQPSSIAELSDRCVQEFGEPENGDAAQNITDLVQSLVDAGVLKPQQ